MITRADLAPAYIHQERQALAINAAKYKNQYAGAGTIFQGESGVYHLTLHTLLETDGESAYKILINRSPIVQFHNIPTTEDYKSHTSILEKVSLSHGDTIEVQFNSHSNGKIPEGDAYAYSRGRWTGITLTRINLVR